MPNSFYRFQPAWNAGFYPDNQITSNLLNTVSSDLATYLATIAIGIPLGQFKSLINAFVNQYNVSPYFGDLSVSVSDSFCSPYQCYNFSIRNNSLFVIDNTQSVDFVAQFNLPALTYSSYTLSAFTPGSYSGTFDYPAIPVEAEVSRSLQIVEQNGSAFFPLTYSFNSGTNIAISGLARGKNWQLDSSGNPTRLPADTLPKQNARTFNVAAQTAEDRYCISLMEKVINYSLTETDETLIGGYYNTFSIPDGWTASFIVVAGTYARIFCLLYRAERSLLMIGRFDTNWIWQRFVSDTTSDNSYFNAYASTTQLPYLPLASYQWLYGDWYDMEFVNFTDSCYVSPEFYAMPAIPGDNWQFNVPSDSGNLTGVDSALVGLFTQDGQFIQQIGETTSVATPPCECVDCSLNIDYILTPAEWDLYLTQVSFLNDTGCDLNSVVFSMAYFIDGVEQSKSTHTFTDPPLVFDFDDISFAVNRNGYELTIVDGNYRFRLPVVSATCGVNYQIKNEIKCLGSPTYTAIWESDVFECQTPEPLITLVQHQASVTIPAKNGCYRMGLYNLPTINPEPTNNNCEINFRKEIPNFVADDFLTEVNNLYGTANPFVTFKLNGETYTYTVPSAIDNPQAGELLIAWANATIPGMVALYDQDIDRILFEWTIEIDCGSTTTFSCCASDSAGVCLDTAYPWFETDSACCPCEPNCQVTFILEEDPFGNCQWINKAELYPDGYLSLFLSTDIGPWDDKYCVKKIPVSELIGLDEGQKLFKVTEWLNAIPELILTGADICGFGFTYTPYVPCNTNIKMVFAYIDASDDLLNSNFATFFETCECSVTPPNEDTYSLYSLSNIINIDGSDCFSTMLEFWANDNSIAQGFEYFNGWKQRVRIGINGGGAKPVIEENLYRQSNGVHRRPQNKQDLSLDLHTDFIDEQTQLALVDATRHPYLVWNNKSIFVKGDIDVATIQDFTTQSSFETLAQVKFSALLQGFQPKNSSCLTC